MTVTFGPTTVLGGSTPAPAPPAGGFSFGATTPAPGPPAGGFSFGSTPAAPAPGPPAFGAPTPGPPAFGTPAPAATSAFSFGGTSSTTTGGLFGSPAPAPGGLFGSPAPAPGGLFGTSTTPGTSIFGAPAPSAFGGFGAAPQQPQQPPQPQVPAQAALQAHMEAMNAAETQKIKAELSKLYAIYTAEVTPSTPSDAKKNFVSIVYNDLTQEQRQMQWLHGVGAGGQVLPIAPPKPPQVSTDDWNRAVVENPDPMNYMPLALVGADALSARLSWQQEQANKLAKDAEMIQASHETAKQLYEQAYRKLEDIQRAHANHRKRLLNIMRKVEVVRCMNQPLQPDEVNLLQQMHGMDLKVQEMRRQLGALEMQTRKPPPRLQDVANAMQQQEIPIPDRERLSQIFTEHGAQLQKLNAAMKNDLKDVELIKQRVVPSDGVGAGMMMAAGGGPPRFR